MYRVKSRVLKSLNLSSSMATLVVILASIPLIAVIYNSLGISADRWRGLWNTRLPELMFNTLSLAMLVAIGSFIMGVSAAWLVTRRSFKGRRLAVWLMVMPLTIPTYVFAHIYTTLLEPDGWLGSVWLSVFGDTVPLPDLYNVMGVAVVLSLAGFSYIFLLVRTALMYSNRSLEEAARMQGATPLQVFWKVNLPLLRPAIAAGLALVVLHVLSDFGAVSMLNFQTFTLSIYMQMSGRFDYQTAAGLSLVLVLLSLTFMMVERVFRSRQRYYSSSQQRKATLKPASPGQQVLIWLWLGLIVFFAFILPVIWMLVWSWESWQANLIDARFWEYVGNSMMVSAIVASIAIVVALPVALFHARQHSRYSMACMHLSSVGFVLPGPVIALGILSFVLAWVSPMYGTLFALLLALVIRFLPLAVQSQEASLQQLTPSIEQVGRVLGASPLENLFRVVLPVIRSGMVSAWVLVFIDALKELPATLLLRPIGFDTLPVRIWIEASEEMLELAAPAALMIVIGTLPVLWLMMKGVAEERGHH